MKKIIFFVLFFFVGTASAAVESVAPVTNNLTYSQYHNYSSLAQLGASLSNSLQQVYYTCTASGYYNGAPISCTSPQAAFQYNSYIVQGNVTCPTATPAYSFNGVTNMCERPLIISCTAPQVPNVVGDACITPVNPQSCNATSVYNPATGMCQQLTKNCVTVTLADGSTSTSCDTVPPLVCPPGKTPGTANGVLMCAGGSPLPTAPAAGGFTGSAAAGAVTNNTTINNSTTTNTTTGSTTVGTSTSTSTTTIDMSPVVAAANATTAAVNAGSMSKFCQDNPKAFSCMNSSATGAIGSAAVLSSQIYTPGAVSGGATFGGSLDNFKTRVLASGVGSAVGSFFVVSAGGGACPTWSATVPVLGSLTFDFFCTSTFQALIPWIKSVILIIFSVVAFRIAIL